jgi:hypothetical protein
MPFQISAQFTSADLRRHGPVVPGAWHASGSTTRGSFLVDTGAGGIGICERVAQELAIQPKEQRSAHGLSGSDTLNFYQVDLHLPARATSGEEIVFRTSVECHGIRDLSTNHQQYGLNVIGILGRVFLQFVHLQVNGASGQVHLLIDDAIIQPRS